MEDNNAENERTPRRFVMLYDTKSVMTILSGIELASKKAHQNIVEPYQVSNLPTTETPGLLLFVFYYS